MKNTKNIFFTLMLIFMIVNNLSSQKLDLKEFKWNNRVVLVMANEINKKYSDQVNQFSSAQNQELLERQIVLIKILNNSYRLHDFKSDQQETDNWQPIEDIFNKYLDRKNDFQFVLLGLDGGAKMNVTKVVTITELFRKIDSMPMRRAEMRHR